MNRDRLAALGRAIVTLALGAAIFYAIGRWLGWWAAGAIMIAGIGAGTWWIARWMARFPTSWRFW